MLPAESHLLRARHIQTAPQTRLSCSSSTRTMFPTLCLFQTLPCPEKPHCKRPNCLFSHRPDFTQIPDTPILVEVSKPSCAPASTSTPQLVAEPTTSIPAKRSISSPLRATAPSDGSAAREPPRKLQRTGPPKRPVAVPSAPTTSSVSLVHLF